MRGKPQPRGHLRLGDRLIPACAGKTPASPPCGAPGADHPRVCGENGGQRMSHYRIKGSSPRVRGKPGDGPTTGPGAGLIPARAGKTGAATPCGTSGRAHPRACGENPVDDGPVGRLPGSSPRVRGKRRRGRHLVGPGRLIPARAGKTCHVVSPIACSWAHPRACGENGDGLADGGPDLGSSPRVRGKPPLSRTWTCLAGLIPACAGKTTGCTGGRARARAHPRVCGETSRRRRRWRCR